MLKTKSGLVWTMNSKHKKEFKNLPSIVQELPRAKEKATGSWDSRVNPTGRHFCTRDDEFFNVFYNIFKKNLCSWKNREF